MDYHQYSISTDPAQNEILIALLSHLPFDTFEEVATGFNAFLPQGNNEKEVEAELDELQQRFNFQFEKTHIPGQNWNEIWESNFHPVIVGNFCGIRADFHEPLVGMEHELVINPKMAFGTGHHETTFSVIEIMQGIQFGGKTVLDYGCGTGVLAILASRLGAASVQAVDIEIESYRNTVENSEVNGAENVRAFHGILSDVPGSDFDVILANINRNVILDSLAPLFKLLKPAGLLVVSGFVLDDEQLMTDSLQKQGFTILETKRKNNWLAIKTVKTG
ncbi:MAG: 50S ribosomal protein L11 methyltransferase [Saprospiraceae bacterium]|nr:50S ribosomal protein L11 methyltransferase [Saprospiraceae bacterium]MCF8251398.1 50S ribosomal protein L11 methyltransferase [Saprospiraceae bacterium]MCF8282635.1 50S ribosomal protein L11 methyltransferase [Bacteroidales bacterium]MCF8312672.1 50S ribosomal protein L11 methyltransferase [Saprospiraceae bacterium]MCF8441062.1 50S ribosomal protein L11 methyltransferase [Saprospiraceae bacterium]